MKVGGEDPHKIQKLVQAPGQLGRFHALYRGSTNVKANDDGRDNDSLTRGISILKPLERAGLINIGTDGLEWDPYDVAARSKLIEWLPNVAKKPLLVPSTTTTSSNTVIPNYLTQQQETLAKILTSIVAPAARNQSFKGLFTLGLRKSIRYASAKLSKGLFRKR